MSSNRVLLTPSSFVKTKAYLDGGPTFSFNRVKGDDRRWDLADVAGSPGERPLLTGAVFGDYPLENPVSLVRFNHSVGELRGAS